MPTIQSKIEKPGPRIPQPNTRWQRTEDRYSGFNRPNQRAMLYALCPVPVIGYHSFSPSQLLIFPSSWYVPHLYFNRISG